MMIAFILFVLSFLASVYLFPKKGVKLRNRNLPPGPFRWPILGNTPTLMWTNSKFPHLALAELAKKYGDVMSFGYGVHYTIVLSSYTAMKNVLLKPETSAKYILPFAVDRAFGKLNHGIVWNNGESWQEVRRFTMTTLHNFGFGKSCSMESVMHEEVDEFLQNAKEEMKRNKGRWQPDNDTMARTAVNVIWALVAGYRFPTGCPTLKKMIALNGRVFEANGAGNLYSQFPFLKTWFPKWSGSESHKETFNEMGAFLKNVINGIRSAREKRMDQEPESFVEVFLDKIREQESHPNPTFTDEQLVMVLNDIFLGGSEPISTSLTWIILFLALHPQVQIKVYQEIVAVVGADGYISVDTSTRMPYTKAVLLEVYRIAYPFPLPSLRKVLKEFTYNGYTFPKGSGIFFNTYPPFMDQEVWGDPHVFRPERFLRLDADGTLHNIDSDKVMAFGIGRRICPGEGLGRSFLLFILLRFVQTFEFRTIPGEEPDLEPVAGGSLSLLPKSYSLQISERN